MNIERKIAHLINLADRPGTPQEGESARIHATKLSIKYGIYNKFNPRPNTRPVAADEAPIEEELPPEPKRPPSKPIPTPNQVFNQWVNGMRQHDWLFYRQRMTKAGRQFCFRRKGKTAEIRITQRRAPDPFLGDADFLGALNDHNYFQAEVVSNPDDPFATRPIYLTINLEDLLRHIEK